jgi:hypothetical protein
MWPMSASPFPLATAVTGAVLLVVLVVGLAAGRTKGRWSLLTAGIVVIAAGGVVLTAAGGAPSTEDPAAEITALFTITVPLVIAFLAGWLAARGSWVRRFVVIAVGALLLVAFPYAAAGQATADAFLGAG